MKISNPTFADPIAAYVAAKKTAVNNWLAARPTNQQFITSDEIRAAFPAEAAFLTDGTIAEIAKALGLQVA